MRKTRLLKHFLLLFALIAGSTSVWAETVPNWSYAIVNGDGDKLNTTNMTFTVDETHVWSYEGTTVAAGTPNVAVAKSNNAYWLKFGSSGSNYYKPVILSTTAFNNEKVTKVRLNLKHNGTKVGTLTVKQGNITIGTCTTDNTSSIIDVECSQDAVGNGGKLEIKYEVAQALYIGKIEVWYETSGTTYSVTYDCNGGTSDCPENLTGITPGTSITLADAPTKTGNTFDGWSDGSETYEAGAQYTVNSNVTFTAQWTSGGETSDETWVLTNLANLTESDVFVIVGDNGSTYAMSNDKGTSSAPTAVSVTVSGGKITSTVTDNIKWNISGDATDGYTFYPDGETETWLYCTNSNNGVRVGTNENNTFTVNEDYLFNTATSRYVGIYSDNSVAKDWRCYTSINANIKNQTFAFYKKVTGDVLTPSIVASDVELAYDATSGVIAFTINNPVETPSVTGAFTQASWISEVNFSLADGKVTFNTTVNNTGAARTATIELRYEEATKIVNVTQAAAPVVYSTIPDLFAAATTTAAEVQVTFDNWVVSGVSTNGKNVFVTDGTNGFVIFDNAGGLNSTYTVGDVLSGTAVSCKLQLYNGFAEITNLAATDLTITAGGTVSAANIAMADLAGVNTGALVSYENLTCSIDNNKYYLSDGTTTLQVFNSLYAFDALEDGKTYNITGIYQQYNTTKEILPRSADDIVEVVSTEASIAVDPTTVNVSADGGAGTITVTYNNITEVVAEVYFCNADGDAVAEGTYSWVTADIDNDNNVEYLIDANEGEARTAYMMVYAFDDDVNGVYSDLITITQAAPVAPFEGATYALANSITPGKHYIIVGKKDDAYKAMGEQRNNNRAAVAVTFTESNGTITTAEGVQDFVISIPGDDGLYAIYDEVGNDGGYLYAASGSNNYLRTQAELSDNSKWEITIGDGGVASIVATKSSNRNVMRYNSSSSLFSCYESSDSQGDVYLYEKVEDKTTVVTISALGYATFGSAEAVDFSENPELKVYTAKVNDMKTEVELTEVASKKVPAGAAVLLQGSAGPYTARVIESADPLTNNDLKLAEQDLQGNGNIYVLNKVDDKVGFYKLNGTLSAGKAYLEISGSGAPMLAITGNEGTTGIVNVNRETITNNQYYTLDGRRVENPSNGIYIVNGKKVVIK